MKNKIIIVTGGASGIGLATAKKLSIDNKVIIADYKDINQDFISIKRNAVIFITQYLPKSLYTTII